MKKLIVLESFAYETLNFVRACSRSGSSLLTLGIAQTCLAILSLNRKLRLQ